MSAVNRFFGISEPYSTLQQYPASSLFVCHNLLVHEVFSDFNRRLYLGKANDPANRYFIFITRLATLEVDVNLLDVCAKWLAYGL